MHGKIKHIKHGKIIQVKVKKMKHTLKVAMIIHAK
jgi:hypothetical protein